MESAGIKAQPDVRVVASADVYVRVWIGHSAVAHYRSDGGTARLYVERMQGRFTGLTYTIDSLPSFAPPTRPLPVWHLEHLGQVAS